MSDQAIEVIVMWGESNVLDVKHLMPARTYTVGEALDDKGLPKTDLMLSATLLGGHDAWPLVQVDGDTLNLNITREMQGWVEINGESVTLSELIARGLLDSSHTLVGALTYRLPAEASAEIQIGDLRFIVRRVAQMPLVAASKPKIDWKSYGWVMASLAFHAFFIVAFYFLPPQAFARNFDLMNIDSRYVDYVLEAPEVADVPEVPDLTSEREPGEDGKAHDGEQGQMGKPSAQKNKNRYAIAGDAKPEDRAMPRDQAEQLAKSAGVIGMLKAAVGTWNVPTSPYGRDQAVGSDAINAIGAIMGDFAGDNWGPGGLGPIGTGRGGGGDGQGTIGTGELGTIGSTGGPGGHGPYGSKVGTLRGHEGRGPDRITIGATEVRGGLSKEAIRRVIHRHLAEIRHCYEQELNARPDLEGRVAVKFMINTSGVVQLANITQSTLGSARAESCIQSAVQRWSFPQGTGVSMVSYPFMFNRAGE